MLCTLQSIFCCFPWLINVTSLGQIGSDWMFWYFSQSSQICTEHKPCEIDPVKLKESENLETNRVRRCVCWCVCVCVLLCVCLLTVLCDVPASLCRKTFGIMSTASSTLSPPLGFAVPLSCATSSSLWGSLLPLVSKVFHLRSVSQESGEREKSTTEQKVDNKEQEVLHVHSLCSAIFVKPEIN